MASVICISCIKLTKSVHILPRTIMTEQTYARLKHTVQVSHNTTLAMQMGTYVIKAHVVFP